MVYKSPLFWPQSLWAKFTLARKTPGVVVLEEGSEFMASHVRERKKGREQCFLLTAVGMWLCAVMASDQKRSRFSNSSYINKHEAFHLCHSEGWIHPLTMLPDIRPLFFTEANLTALALCNSFLTCFPASGLALSNPSLSAASMLLAKDRDDPVTSSLQISPWLSLPWDHFYSLYPG